MSEVELTSQVQRDVQRFKRAAALAVATNGLLALWQAHVLPADGGRLSTLLFALTAVAFAANAWRDGNRRLRARLYVLSPVFLAGMPLVACVGSFAGVLVAFVVSFLLALVATAAFGYTRPRRRR
jgi:VIT1/CCC1 family predicted Fe2+/Mn2+ transporter